MDPHTWLEKARRELATLAPIAHGDEADAWRAAVLIARLHGNPLGLEFSFAGSASPPRESAMNDDPIERARTLVEVAGPPDPQTLLDDLADALDDDEDPAGPLHDVMLDVDDAVGVTALIGDAVTANALALRAAALVSLYPGRVFALGSFAEMRLGTLAPRSPIATLWEAVEQAPAALLVESLPPVARSRPAAARRPRLREVSFPSHLHQAAASSSQREPIRLDIPDTGLLAWLEEDAGKMLLEIRGDETAPSRASLVAYDAVTDDELVVEPLILEVAGKTAYADLGPWAGSDNALHRLVTRTGRPAHEIEVRLRLDDD